jgi:curved DNA-binding protein CbpA
VSHYEVLGVSTDASTSDIRRAYVARARRSHPDFHADADSRTRARNEREMRRLNEAWAVLGDPARRHRYDASLQLDSERLRREAERSRPQGTPHPEFVPFDDDDTDYAALLDDAPDGNGARLPRAAQLAPALLLLVAIFFLSAGAVTSYPPILAVGFAALALSVLSFVLVPAWAVMRSLQSDRE